MSFALHHRRILLVISGGIAAYKSLDLIRRLKEQGATVRCVLTKSGAQFITPLSVAALSGEPVHDDLWSLDDQARMEHIRLSRESDLILVAPATADLLAKMAQGLADDLASTLLLASDKPVMVAPAMNVMMWAHAATAANVERLRQRGVRVIGPGGGDMACGEQGEGRMAEVAEIVQTVTSHFTQPGPLAGLNTLVTAGPTHEPIDPVRFIGNRSSGTQGFAIAEALRLQGANTVLVTGPTQLADLPGVRMARVQTAVDMLNAVEANWPTDIAICNAAVADWRVDEISAGKIKKTGGVPELKLVENPDILARLSQPEPRRPRLVIGFAAETGDVQANAAAKLARKGCDWLVANEVGSDKGFDDAENAVTLLRRGQEPLAWPEQPKSEIARKLVQEIIHAIA